MNNLNQSSDGPGGNQPPRPKWTNMLPWLLLAFLVLAWFLPSLLNQGGSQGNEQVSYSTFVGQVDANNVQSVTISDYTVTGVFKLPVLSQDGTTKSTQFTTTMPQFGNNDLITLLEEHHVAITITSEPSHTSTPSAPSPSSATRMMPAAMSSSMVTDQVMGSLRSATPLATSPCCCWPLYWLFCLHPDVKSICFLVHRSITGDGMKLTGASHLATLGAMEGGSRGTYPTVCIGTDRT